MTKDIEVLRVSDERLVELARWARSEEADCLQDDMPVSAGYYADVIRLIESRRSTDMERERPAPAAPPLAVQDGEAYGRGPAYEQQIIDEYLAKAFPAAAWRRQCAASDFHDHDGCSCTDAELYARYSPPSQAIDAGDGEAEIRAQCQMIRNEGEEAADAAENAIVAMFHALTHPAGTVSVSDEMVEAALGSWFGDDWPSMGGLARTGLYDDMHAALTAALSLGGSKE